MHTLLKTLLGSGLLGVWITAAAAGATNETALDSPTTVALEALSRLEGVNLEENPAVKTAVLKLLAKVRGRAEFVQIVQKFGLKDQAEGLLEVAINQPAADAGITAMRSLLDSGAATLLQRVLAGTNALTARRVAEALGNTTDNHATAVLAPVVDDPSRDPVLRKESVKALAKTAEGAAYLLKQAREGKLGDDVRVTASLALNQARWPEVKAEAARLLPPPQGGNAQALPPISELLKRKGDAVRGAAVFARETTGCNKCHQVNGQGIDFGPALSEIGSKLGRDALYEAILDPSAGIAFGYEGFQLNLAGGEEAFGLIVSETNEEVALKDQRGIVSRYPKSKIQGRERQKLSVMPAGLEQTMTPDELVDLVEYLFSLKKPAAP